jgi:hypothetical protein
VERKEREEKRGDLRPRRLRTTVGDRRRGDTLSWCVHAALRVKKEEGELVMVVRDREREKERKRKKKGQRKRARDRERQRKRKERGREWVGFCI